MDLAKIKNYRFQLIGLILSFILFFTNQIRIPYLDTKTDSYFTNTLLKASGAYAVTRGLNATVSILKESTFSLEPAGIGVSLAAGQVLDPIDDMTERLSDVLVVAIVSLGFQKIFYEMSIKIIPKALGIILFSLSFLAMFKRLKVHLLYSLFTQFAAILIIARLFLPLSTLINSYLHDIYFAPKIQQSSIELNVTARPLSDLQEVSTNESKGFWGKLRGNVQFIKNKTSQMKVALKEITSKMESSIDHLVQLTLIYISVFIFQVILLPLLFIWILSRLISFAKIYLPTTFSHTKETISV